MKKNLVEQEFIITSDEVKIAILADLWMNYRDDEQFEDFCQYNDIGLPLAYFINSGLVTPLQLAAQYVAETFDLLCASLNIPLDGDYDNLNAMFMLANKLNNQ